MIEELIKVEKTIIGGEEVNSVDMRDVYNYLEVKKDYTDWCKAQIKRAMLDENSDYILFPQKGEKGNKPISVYICTLDSAKSIAMLSQTEKGKEVRKYFIQVEKVAKNVLGEKRLELEIKAMEEDINHKVEMNRQEEIVAKIGVAKVLQDLGASFDPVALADGKFVSKLPKDIGEVLTEAMSDIRVGVRTYSTTYLLAENGIDILTRDFNSALMLAGILEEYKYNGKTYKRFVNKHNYYGYNQDASSIRTNPVLVKMYEDRFLQLVQLLRNEGYID